MQTYHIQTTIRKDGTVTIKRLPFRVGEKVEVIIRGRELTGAAGERYPLRGQPFRYDDPFKGVADSDWAALQ